MSIATGTRLGPYEVASLIGAGGMGEVYKARDTRLDRIVAIKVLPAHLADKPDLRERFEREARTIASLNHPHICTLHDIGQQDGIDFLVMEYLEGETLATRLMKGPLPLEQVLQYAIEISDALDKAHRKGVTHRDIKPGNVMLTKAGTKLLDFGLAKLKQAAVPAAMPVSQMPTLSQNPTIEGTLLGTLQYMAPEQVEGKVDEIDGRTDIFAFGAVVYEMATGKKAFEGKTSASLIAKILKHDPLPISSLQPMTPPTLDRIVKRCLAKEPDERWQNAGDLMHELKWTTMERERSVSPRSSGKVMTRRRWLALAGTLVGAAALTVWMALGWPVGTAGTGSTIVVLMDSTQPQRIYDDATRAAGGTNADDLTNVLRDLPLTLIKENTSATWNREDEVLRQAPDLIVVHRSCFYDATFGGDPKLGQLTNPLALDKFEVFMGYIGQGNPNTRFLVYSRGAWDNDPENRQRWVESVEARFPTLRGRVTAWQVPLDRATFRNPTTGAEIREQIEMLLDN